VEGAVAVRPDDFEHVAQARRPEQADRRGVRERVEVPGHDDRQIRDLRHALEDQVGALHPGGRAAVVEVGVEQREA
jgi:hypothetical protein